MKKEFYDKITARLNRLERVINGGKGSGDWGHQGRPGQVGGSGKGSGKPKKEQRIRTAIEKSIAGQKKLQDEAKVVREDIESRIGQKLKDGEITAIDMALKARFKTVHGEDGTEYTYDKENGMITTFDPDLNEEVVITKQKDESKPVVGAEAYKAIGDSQKRAKAKDEKIAAEDRKQISKDLDDFAGFGGYSRRDELKTIGASLTNLTTDIKSAKEQVKRLKDASDSQKWQDRATTLTRLGEVEKAIREADRLLKDKDFIKGVGDSKKTLIEMAKTELKRGQKTLSDYYDKLDKGQ